MVKLQLALDVLNIEDAILISEELSDYVDIIELGTSLIKEESAAESIMIIKRLFPHNQILADFKTMSKEKIKAGMAFDAGADIMTIPGNLDNKIIEEVIHKSKKSKKRVMVDIMQFEDNLKRALELDKLNPDYICLHTEISKNNIYFDELKEMMKKIKSKIAIAGGINTKNIREVLKINPEIIIIGRALTLSKNIVNDAKLLNKIIKRKVRKIHKKNERHSFIKITKIIDSEIKHTLHKINSAQTKNLVKLFYHNYHKKVYVTGEGKSGSIGKAFVMRLMHLGYNSYFISESIVPIMDKGDIFISISGTGKTVSILERVKLAKKQNAITFAITANKKSPIATKSKFVIEIPAFIDTNREPLGSLFEQSTSMYIDKIIVELMQKFNKSPFSLRKFNASVY